MSYAENYKLIAWKELPPLARKVSTPVARSSLAAPMLITDEMPPTEHVDGNHYTSKSSFRAVTKANDLTEVGNDVARLKTPKQPDRDKSISASIDKAIARSRA